MATTGSKAIFKADNKVLVTADGNTELCTVTVAKSSGVITPESFFVMNFESMDNADFQIVKALNQKFMFTSFGNAAVSISLSGFQVESFIDYTKSATTTQDLTYDTDAETFYRKYNIGRKSRILLNISTRMSTAAGTYKGYMVGFRKKPQGEQKLNGYAFSIQLICWKDDADDN